MSEPSSTQRKTGWMMLAIAVVAAAELTILFSGYRILLWEQRGSESAPVVIADHEPIGPEGIVCRYFNGRGISSRVYWYSANNLMGRDACPFLLSSRE